MSTIISSLFTAEDSKFHQLLESFPLVTSPLTVLMIVSSLILAIKITQNYRSIFQQKLIPTPSTPIDLEPINLILNGFFFGILGAGILIALPLINYGGDCFNCNSINFSRAKEWSTGMTLIDVKLLVLRFFAFAFFLIKIINFWRPLSIAIENQINQGSCGNNKLYRRKNVSNAILIDMFIQVFLVLIGVVNHPSSVLMAHFLIDGFLTCATYGYYVVTILERNSFAKHDGISFKSDFKNSTPGGAGEVIKTNEFDYTYMRKKLIIARIVSFFFLSFHGFYFMNDSKCGNPVTILIQSVYFLSLGFYSGRKYLNSYFNPWTVTKKE